MDNKNQQVKEQKVSKQKDSNANVPANGKEPIRWKLILGTGVILGVVACLINAVNPGYAQLVAPMAMLLAIYYITPKLESQRLLSAFLASTIAGWLGWVGLIIKLGKSKDVLTTLTVEFIPVWLIFSVLMSWFNIWVSDRAVKRRQKQEAEKRAKAKAERDALKPPAQYRKKKKKWKKKK